MPGEKVQEEKMRWILFCVITGLFSIIVIITMLAVFFGLGALKPDERALLFKGFIIEIGVAVFALFYSLFRLKRDGNTETQDENRNVNSYTIRLNFGEGKDTQQFTRQFIGKEAQCTMVSLLDEKSNRKYPIVYENWIPTIRVDNVPKSTKYIQILVGKDESIYNGALYLKSDLFNVDMAESASSAYVQYIDDQI